MHDLVLQKKSGCWESLCHKNALKYPVERIMNYTTAQPGGAICLQRRLWIMCVQSSSRALTQEYRNHSINHHTKREMRNNWRFKKCYQIMCIYFYMCKVYVGLIIFLKSSLHHSVYDLKLPCRFAEDLWPSAFRALM